MLPERTLTKSPLVNVIITAILNASRGVRRDYTELSMLQNSKRGFDHFVSTAAQKAHEKIMEDLKRARSKFTFAKEDMVLNAGQDYWLISPIVGIENLKRALPQFAISVAYSRGEEVISSVIYDVLRDELFWAEKGTGAYVNRERLRISSPKKMEDALCIIHTSQCIHALQNLQIKPSQMRVFDCPALDIAYIAAARADIYIGPALSLLHSSAGKLLVQEAGGIYKEQNGSIYTGNLDTLAYLEK